MKTTSTSKWRLNSSLVAAFVLFFNLFAVSGFAQQKKTAKNIVLVHGAFVDGSGWRKVHDILAKKGYNVTIVQYPLTSLQDDVAATKRILDRQDGPTVLVGHSWGGTIITEAGVHPNVASLVYVAAFVPEKGENTFQLATSLPASPKSGLLPPDDKGFIYYDKAKFHDGFAGDLSKAETDFMYASQAPIFGASFTTQVTENAWKTKPSYAVVATEDNAIVPGIQRNMYKRAGAKTTEVKGSHAVFISQPEAVAKVIIEAAEGK